MTPLDRANLRHELITNLEVAKAKTEFTSEEVHRFARLYARAEAGYREFDRVVSNQNAGGDYAQIFELRALCTQGVAAFVQFAQAANPSDQRWSGVRHERMNYGP